MKKMLIGLLSLVSLSVFAQRDVSFNPPRAWDLDSVTFVVYHVHTQSQADDSVNSIRTFIAKYIYVRNDMLYAKFPKNYTVYAVADFEQGTNTKTQKVMIAIQGGGSERYYYTSDLLTGEEVPLISIRKPVDIILSL